MWIIQNGTKKEYDPSEVYTARADDGKYLVTIADNIRQGSIIVLETYSQRKARVVEAMLTMGIGTNKTYRLDL